MTPVASFSLNLDSATNLIELVGVDDPSRGQHATRAFLYLKLTQPYVSRLVPPPFLMSAFPTKRKNHSFDRPTKF